MRIRTTTAAIVAVLAVTVVGCGSSQDSDQASDSRADTAKSPTTEESSPEAEASSPADDNGAAENTYMPREPTGAERDAVIAAVKDVHGKLIHDEDKALDAARNQCASLNGGAKNPDHDAAQRFSYNGVELTDEDGRHINIGLRKTLCPES
ncbi:hypothetical protein [Streptomyces sparsus]